MYKITLDGSYLYHPWIRGRCITEGALTQEVNKNGSCDVSIVLDHPLAAIRPAAKVPCWKWSGST